MCEIFSQDFKGSKPIGLLPFFIFTNPKIIKITPS